MPHRRSGSQARRPVRQITQESQITQENHVTEEVRAGRIPLHTHPGWARAFPWVVQGTTVRRVPAVHAADPPDRNHAQGSSVARELAQGSSVVREPAREKGVVREPARDCSVARESDTTLVPTAAREPAPTGPGEPVDLDFGLFTRAPAGAVMKRWEHLARDTGCGSLVHARQVHGREIALHEGVPPGLLLIPPCDGHATRQPGALLAVTVADCVPVFVVAPRARAVMLLHAGWRGVAGGILEAGLAMLERDFHTRAREARIHMGPAICGRCYEVGREVHEALGLPRPATPTRPVDLRRVLVDRALAGGADPAHLSTSTFCTRCADTPFFSHRNGDAGRQVAVLGIAPNDSRAGGPTT